ncbi:mechanosensitive ion channel [Mucilaginibacter daejeonensis]|uniref:mechanosensitive ion channel family protein n=1 Tax=Mucilaginibacter daejeonensis TaxID=398049 RepID=UPI001D176BDB|nr:mechanosensitive ion channel domain-containing protein [Mucilaginibacter daejeonensis]UEG55064.1 mechanosensitive ion channel [Mucilaginibacter daejeonensis]
MYRTFAFRALICCLVLALITPFFAAAQTRKKHKRTVTDSLRAAMLRRDSMMRYYKTSDTSTNNLLQRIEYYTLSFNQISNKLSKGLDTVRIAAALPDLERTATVMRTLIGRNKAGTLRYLYSIRDVLNKRQDQLDVWQDQLVDISDDLVDIDEAISKIHGDSLFRIFPSDSTLRLTFLEQRAAIEIKAQKLDSMNRRALLRVGKMQNRLANVYIAILDEKELINTKIRNFSINALNCEYGYLWNMKNSTGSTFKSALKRTVLMNTRLFRLLNGEALKHIAGILLLLGMIVWLVINKRRISKLPRKAQQITEQTQYVTGYPIASSLLVVSLIVPYFYNTPPIAFVEILFMISVSALLYLIYRTCPTPLFSFLLKLFAITVVYSLSNLFVEVSNVDRIIILLLAITTTWFSLKFLKHINISNEKYVPYSRTALWLLIVAQAASVLLNIAGRFSLAKIVAVTSLFNLWLAMCLYYFVQTVIQALFLQLEANKIDKESISSYLDFKLLQGKLRSVLNIVAAVMWFVMLLQNLSIEDSFFDLVGSFLNQSRKLGGTLFTFGSIIIFAGVIWLASVAARVISYFYDFADQHAGKSAADRKNRTSLLLIRIGVFSVGFLLAVGASGFPLDKITIIISALGVGVGFGLQNIVNNLVSGLILAFEKPVQVGDVIEVSNRAGTIKEIGIRSSKIATGNGAEIIIPNGDLISQHVINWTLSDNNRQVELRISVAYGTDIDKVKNLLRNLVSNRDDIMVKPAPVVYLDTLSSASVDLVISFWAADLSMFAQLKSVVLTEIYKAFEAEGIKIPKPQPELVLRVPQGTDAMQPPPAAVTSPTPGQPDQGH